MESKLKNKNNVSSEEQNGNFAKTVLCAVPSRLVEVGQMITSKRTGKTLKCYNVMACYIGVENRFKHWEYSFWDEDKEKCNSVRHRVLQEWLNGVWSVVE